MKETAQPGASQRRLHGGSPVPGAWTPENHIKLDLRILIPLLKCRQGCDLCLRKESPYWLGLLLVNGEKGILS